jgi:hypothetical protein
LCSSGIISVNKWVDYVARRNEIRHPWIILVGKSTEDNMEEIRVDGRIISKWILKEIGNEEVNRIRRCNESSVSVNGKYKSSVNCVNDIFVEK